MDDSTIKALEGRFPFKVALAVTFITALIPALFILLAGNNPIDAYVALIAYTLGSWHGFLEVLTQAIPLTLVGLGVAIAFRAGIFNIGGDGQLLMGAILSFAVASLLGDLPRPLGLVLYLAIGFIGGGLLGAFVGWLKVRFNASEIISTIVLNFIVLQFLSWLIRGPLQEPARMMPWSNYLPDSLVLLPIFDGSGLHQGLWITLFVVLMTTFVMKKTSFGFKTTAVGLNFNAANYAGLRVKRVVIFAMLISGGLAGLAGSILVSGVLERLQDDFASGYGQSAIAIALIARLSPALVPLAALLFGVFYVGAGVLQREANIPFPIVHIIEGVVIFGFLYFDMKTKRKGGV